MLKLLENTSGLRHNLPEILPLDNWGHSGRFLQDLSAKVFLKCSQNQGCCCRTIFQFSHFHEIHLYFCIFSENDMASGDGNSVKEEYVKEKAIRSPVMKWLNPR